MTTSPTPAQAEPVAEAPDPKDERLRIAAKQAVAHWAEFGPEYDFDEVMHWLDVALKAAAAQAAPEPTTVSWWDPVQEDVSERAIFDSERRFYPSITHCIARTLAVMGRNMGRGSCAAQLSIMANEVAKLTAAPEPTAEARDAWMPIETAPMDGTEILLCIEGDDDSVAIGYWAEYHDSWAYSGEAVPMGKPTHWMRRIAAATAQPGEPA